MMWTGADHFNFYVYNRVDDDTPPPALPALLAAIYQATATEQAGLLVMVNTHLGASGLKIGEMLVQGDRPVIEYRRRREELIAEANAERVQR
jgi:hypothetical protein